MKNEWIVDLMGIVLSLMGIIMFVWLTLLAWLLAIAIL